MLQTAFLLAWILTWQQQQQHSVAHAFIMVPRQSQQRTHSHHLHATDSDIVREKIESLLSILSSAATNTKQTQNNNNNTTVVHLLGTGITGSLLDMPLSSLQLLSQADVVLYDALSLSLQDIGRVVRSDCILRSVGKRGGNPTSVLQSDIDTLLVKYATELPAGSTIIRLKGGDPLLFGRARTEVDALRASGTCYTIVPALTSCVAGPHFAGIPLTDPVLNCQSFAVFSGTRADKSSLGQESGTTSTGGSSSRDWSQLEVDAMVFLMIGELGKLEALCNRLVTSGGDKWTGDTPCAVVQSAGRMEQRVFRGTLHTQVETIKQELGAQSNSVSPAILVVGQVAALNLLES